ncbi:MAG: efflux RND transporter permease subunit [Pseudomonadota bacterium]
MDALTRFGLDNSRFTWLMMALILLLGVTSYLGIPKREDPAITIRTAVVSVEFPGMSPERLEDLIAVPVERKLREIGEIEDIETIISTGSALIYVTLYDNIYGSNIEAAWEDLRNKMNDVVGELPEDTLGPFVNTDYGDVAIATIAVTGDGFDLAYIEDVAEELQRELYTLDGITKVALYGEQDERIWLELDTRELASVGVQLSELFEDLRAQNVILPAGEIDAGGTNVVLEANGDLGSVDEIRNVLTQVDGLDGFVRLEDLVDVRRGYVDPLEEPAFFNGEPAVILAVEMSEETDIQDLGQRLRAKIRDVEHEQPIGISFSISTFQETNVTQSVNGALSNLGQTFVIVFLVMLLFLGFRPAVVIACIVPFTVCFALTVMGPLGVDIEQVSISAVIVSLGLLVDNGLVVVEDIDGRTDRGVPAAQAALEAGKQYAIPLGVASITTISAFVPMLLVEGSEGEFSYSMGAVVASMLAGSWITALYILPFLSTRILKSNPVKAGSEGIKTTGVMGAYGRVIRRLLPFGIPIVAVVYGLVVFSGSQMGQIRAEFFPLSERADFLVYMDMPKGTAISETEHMADRVTAWMTDEELNPDIVSVTAYVGSGGPRFNLGLDPADPDPASAFLQVNTIDLDSAIETSDRARRVFVEEFPEARFRVTRLAQGGSESGIVEVEIAGPDAEVLLAVGDRVQAVFDTLPELVMSETDWGNKVVKVVLEVAQDKAREFGVTSEDISQVMETYFSGTVYSTFREGDAQIPITLRANEASRNSIEDLGNLSIAANDQLISIDQVASFQPRLEYSELRRENQVRQIIISGKSNALSAAETLAVVQPVLEDLDLGQDYTISIGGELADSADVQAKLGGNLPFALGIMLAALVFQFNSIRRSVITFLTIPMIVIGAPYALLLNAQPFSFFALLGMMSLMGIIINNAIVLINQIDIDRESMEFSDAIIHASQQRFRPILLTSLTTICGLLPMAISGGALFEPMATVMIGGLAVASPLSLLVVPSLYYLFLKDRQSSRDDAQPSTPA